MHVCSLPSAVWVRAARAIALGLCAVALALTAAQAFAEDAAAERGPIGIGGRTYSPASEEYVAEKLGIGDAAAPGEKLVSSTSPRSYTYAYEAPVEEVQQPAATETADYVEQAPAQESQAQADPGYTYTEPTYTEQAPVEEAPAVEQAPVEEAPVEEAPAEDTSEWYTTIASAYDPNCNGGTATSSGIPLDWTTPTVASIWVPDGTYIEIVYNGMSVIAQVTDTGPFVAGRELDLAPGTFQAFGFSTTDEWGVREVSYRIL